MKASEIRSTAGHHIDTETRRGVDTFDEVVAGTVGYLEGKAEAHEVRPVVAEAFAAHLEQQLGWPELLDSDRLHRTFRMLELDGVIARTDFMCCRSCGIDAIDEFVAATGRAARGYTFFHAQDAETAVNGGGIQLSYGTLSPDVNEIAKIGQEVAARLRECGLRVDWDGDPGARICVDGEWQRRRLGSRAAYPGSPDGPAPETAPLLVTLHDYTRERGYEADIPMTYPECRGTLYELPASELSFVSAETTVEDTLTALVTYWRIEDGRARLWMEVFHRGNFDHAGRYVTPDENDRVLTAFATEQRVILGELGELKPQF